VYDGLAVIAKITYSTGEGTPDSGIINMRY
jgi:hypothetical protein